MDEQQPTNDTAPEQPAQPLQPGQMALGMTPQGMQITLVPPPMNIAIGEEGMNRLVEEWLASHPAFADVLLKKHIEALRAQKSHLALVQHIRKTRND